MLYPSNGTLNPQHVLTGVNGGGGGKSAQPATCLLVLLLSVALVALPSLREEVTRPRHADSSAPAALRRALLSATSSEYRVQILLDAGPVES